MSVKANIGVAMAGGGGASGGRQADDYYPTPPDITLALLSAWRPSYPVWEMACGDGAMARVMEGCGQSVIGTDLRDRGYGLGGVDFLAQDNPPAGLARGAWTGVTNPPFAQAAAFIEHAFVLGAAELAMLLKGTFWHAARRHGLFLRHPPSAVYPLTWRPDFLNLKAPTMECAWMVWRAGYAGPTEYRPLAKKGTWE